jgi:predicted transcriptional regulator
LTDETPQIPQKVDISTLRLDQPGIRAALGDLEAEIMERVWQRPGSSPVTVREIWEELYPSRPVMYTTVMNTMTRLARKGLLEADKETHAFRYRPTLDREAFVDSFVAGALERLLVNFGGQTRAQLRRLQTRDRAVQERLVRLLEGLQQRRTGED